jgi:hypothetical protein
VELEGKHYENQSVRLDLVLWVNAFVLDFEELIQLLDKLIEGFWVLFALDARAEVVHFVSFLRGHRSASKKQRSQDNKV